jgi:hypothetical protein
VNRVDLTGKNALAELFEWVRYAGAATAAGAKAAGVATAGAIVGLCGIVFMSDTQLDDPDVPKTPPANDNGDRCLAVYHEQSAYCGETYTDDYRYEKCMAGAWENYLRCLNGLPPMPLISWY